MRAAVFMLLMHSWKVNEVRLSRPPTHSREGNESSGIHTSLSLLETKRSKKGEGLPCHLNRNLIG